MECNTTENLRLWLRECPAISQIDRFGVDFLGQNPTEYTIFSVPSTIAYGKDILGELYVKPIQEINYIFACRFPFSKNILQNLDNLGFFTQVRNWIIAQNKQKNFPDIAEGIILSVIPTLTPYVFEAGSDSGRYQIQLKVTYRTIE